MALWTAAIVGAAVTLALRELTTGRALVRLETTLVVELANIARRLDTLERKRVD